MIALQNVRIAVAKKQAKMIGDLDTETEASHANVSQLRQAQAVRPVPIPVVQRGPAVYAWELLQQADATQEQIDAVSVFALCLQKKFDERPNKESIELPLSATSGNHEALWLGGGGVGKTRTLKEVVEPLAVAYFGEEGYLATAQCNSAATQLGRRGRTIHSSNGLLASSSLKTAQLVLNEASRKKLDKLKGPVGVETTDELGCVHAELLHAAFTCTPSFYMAQEKFAQVLAKFLLRFLLRYTAYRV